MVGMTITRANEIETAVRNAVHVTVHQVVSGHGYVDIEIDGAFLRCVPGWYDNTIFVSGESLVNFHMPQPQWYTDALAGGAYESDEVKAAAQRNTPSYYTSEWELRDGTDE